MRFVCGEKGGLFKEHGGCVCIGTQGGSLDIHRGSRPGIQARLRLSLQPLVLLFTSVKDLEEIADDGVWQADPLAQDSEEPFLVGGSALDDDDPEEEAVVEEVGGGVEAEGGEEAICEGACAPEGLEGSLAGSE